MIDEIVSEIEALPDAKAATKFSEKFTNSQGELVAFLLAALGDSSSEAQETGLFIALVAWRYFSQQKTLHKISEESITQKFTSINQDMEAFENGDEGALERIVTEQAIEDNELLRFVAEEIQAAREDDAITEDDAGNLFVVSKVVVECLVDAIAT